MSFLLDLFTNTAAQQAAQDQIQAIQQGLNYAQGQIGQGNQALTTNYTAALQPYLQNYSGAQQGTAQLANVLGLNGPSGNQSALAALQSTPGYQFALGQGNNAINAQQAATGQLNSGNTALALSKFNQGLASNTYGQYVSQLSPYLNYSTQGATGIAGVDTGLGSGLNSNSNTLANLGMNAYTSMGNAQANAALAQVPAAANIFDALLGVGSLGSSLLGGGILGGGSLGGLGSGITSLVSGVGEGGLPTGYGSAMNDLSTAAALTYSDERLKEHVEPIGKLYDGTNIFRYLYKGDSTPRIGVMAQEIEKRYPDAVKEIGHFKAVDYGKATNYAAEIAKFLKEAA